MDYGSNYAENPYQTGNMNPDSPNEYGYSSTPHHPYYHEPDHLNMPQPQFPQSGSPAPDLNPELYDYSQPQRPASSNTGHINDAVHSAVHNSGPTGYLSPEVISQITATVIQQLKTTGLDNVQGSGAPPPRSQSQQPPWQTDASLQPHLDSPPVIPPQTSSPIHPSSASDNIHPRSFSPYVPSGYVTDSPSPKLTQDPFADSARVDSSSVSSQSSEHSEHSHYSHHKLERPKAPDRDATVVEMTTFERYWGKLFEDGKSTKRLGQFLRGIAMHLIEDFPPGNTIVIPPYKMQQFYRDTHCANDPYLWQDIFDDKISSLSRLFREIGVEHHLIQNEDLKERPNIPGLTPKGFETWATLLILANPEREHERLQKAVRNMPINNPDDKKERFPKEIPRRLFPELSDISIREELEDQMMVHCGVDMPYITEEERRNSARPARSSTTTASPTERTHSYERGRPRPPSAQRPIPKPVSIVTDDEESIPSVPIERERKPYSANPGGGKVYEEAGRSRSQVSSFSTPRPSDSTHVPSARRDSQYSHAGSGAGDQRYTYDSRSSSRSVNNPGGDYRHSESDVRGRDHAPRYGGLSAHDLHYSEVPLSRPDEDRRKHRRGSHGSHGSRGSHGSLGDDEYYLGRASGSGHGYYR